MYKCQRCGSESVSVWTHNGHCRIRCGYCDADTGEQKNAAVAERIWNSFKKVERETDPSIVRVMTLDEVLDASCYDAEFVRPIWFENRGIFCSPMLMLCSTAERMQDCVRVVSFKNFGPTCYDMRNYGSWWRCWTGKPSEEQMDGTPWES